MWIRIGRLPYTCPTYPLITTNDHHPTNPACRRATLISPAGHIPGPDHGTRYKHHQDQKTTSRRMRSTPRPHSSRSTHCGATSHRIRLTTPTPHPQIPPCLHRGVPCEPSRCRRRGHVSSSTTSNPTNRTSPRRLALKPISEPTRPY